MKKPSALHHFLLVALGLSAVAQSLAQNSEYENKWEMSLPRATIKQGIKVTPLEDGDFLVDRIKRAPKEPEDGITFFKRRLVKSIDNATEPATIVFIDGSKVPLSSEIFSTLPKASKSAAVWISDDNAWRTTPADGCYFGPLSYNIRLSSDKFALSKDSSSKAIAVFKLSTKPKREVVSSCIYGVDEELNIRLHAIKMDDAWPLRDGGFLILLDREVLIRFDRNLTTKSALIGHSYFVAASPTELVGSQTDRLLEMPALASLSTKCKGGNAPCTIQFLHDQLLETFLNSKRGAR